MAGLFPAILLSSFKPISVLKGMSGVKLFSKLGIRRTLIVAQFSLSLFLIISVRLVGNQLEMMMSADYGYNPDGIINVMLHNTDYDILQSELSTMSSIGSISAARHSSSTVCRLIPRP